jgi:hypothetical protein
MTKKYNADIILEVNSFEASSREEAVEIINQYISLIASTEGEINWDSVNYTIQEEE